MTGPLPDFYTDPLYKGSTADFLQYHVCLNKSGVGMHEITWCRKNCKGEWGWFFRPTGGGSFGLAIKIPGTYANYRNPERSVAYMTFDNTQDALKFKLNLI